MVVTRDSYEARESTTDPEADADRRIRVLTWVLGLQDGPPPGGVFDPFRETMFSEVDETRVESSS